MPPLALHNPAATIWTPPGVEAAAALARITILGVAAHPDDLEIVATRGILDARTDPAASFAGIVLSDGAGSPRAGRYASFSEAEMRAQRRAEQKRAAEIGGYGAVVFLDYTSDELKSTSSTAVIDDLLQLLAVARPHTVYTHNLADRHDTHVATTLRVIAALRRLPRADRPRRVLGGEVWRDLDWLERGKVRIDLSDGEVLTAALFAAFESQLAAKRYDLALLARRRGHATFDASHAADNATHVAYAMDLTPLIEDDALEPSAYVASLTAAFATDVQRRLENLRTE